jgi:hypothetical protein
VTLRAALVLTPPSSVLRAVVLVNWHSVGNAFPLAPLTPSPPIHHLVPHAMATARRVQGPSSISARRAQPVARTSKAEDVCPHVPKVNSSTPLHRHARAAIVAVALVRLQETISA